MVSHCNARTGAIVGLSSINRHTLERVLRRAKNGDCFTIDNTGIVHHRHLVSVSSSLGKLSCVPYNNKGYRYAVIHGVVSQFLACVGKRILVYVNDNQFKIGVI